MTIINERAVHCDIAAQLRFEPPDSGTQNAMERPLIDHYQTVAPHDGSGLLPKGHWLSQGVIWDLGYSVRQSMTRLLGASNSIDGVFRLTRAVRHQRHRVV